MTLLQQRCVRESLTLCAVALSIAGAIDQCCAQEGRFQQVEEGLLDTETGLVWGFDLQQLDGSWRTWEPAVNLIIWSDTEWSTYPEFSNWYFGRDDDDWRLPTRDELLDAANAGIAEYLDASPNDGFQPIYAWSWSSTYQRYRGIDAAWEVNLWTGETKLINVGSAISAIPVRGAPPPEEPSKPGKGKKK